ncbi:LamG domain-containing protein [Streptomyces sp. WMMB 322]|uniref:LamG domain-containing protein n=1 Tax=Streptomyces sp. WMMB 322 TaxID=1286821 RepID=UPI0006E14739|nr:LamG domain-containing protein [Streptomyces sp. WMMB 322]SCK53583.1 Concanavalin A-like lectin/glucanases superfamily protein [Streptomyces sp. WMMB 322]
MEPEWLSDIELAELVHGGGEPAAAALTELRRRHFGAVRKLAALCVSDEAAGDQLAERAWQLAMWPHGTGGTGALRPRALASVLRAAAETAGTSRNDVLDADLAGWLGMPLTVPDPAFADGGGVTLPLGGSTVTEAFDALPANLQAAMWHHLVEHADDGFIGRLLGSDSPDSQEISALLRRAYRDFYHAYEQIHLDGMTDDCRRFHRMVMAYADQRGGNTADVVPHLQQCHYCSRAVADLRRMYTDFGELLVEALLPWGGSAYAAARQAEATSATVAVPGGEGAAPAPGAAAEGTVPPPGDHRGALGRATWDMLGRTGLAERNTGGFRVRSGRLTLAVGALSVCSLVAAFAYAPELGSRLPVSSGAPPAKETPTDPEPSKSGGSGPSGSPTGSPSSPGSSSQAPGGQDGRTPGPRVRGASLEWLFDDVKGDVAPDSTGNDRDGTLIGDPQPKPRKDGGVAFFGKQSVATQDPVFDTDSSFSVSARVKLRNKDEYQTVASQDGTEVSSFQLQFDPVEDRWEMRMHREDTQTSRADEAESDAAPRAGRWTSLAGVYDAPEGLIRLYVDGKLQETVRREGDRSSEGVFAVGRARLGDQLIRGFEGTIKNVRAFPKALSDKEAKALAAQK